MIKKLTIGLSVIAFCLALYYGQFWLQYYWSTEKSNSETAQFKCKDGIKEEFSGIINKVNHYEYNDFMNKNFFAVQILTTDSVDRFKTYQFNLKEYKDVLEFVNVGQKIEKIKGQDTFKVVSDNGQEKSFSIPYCRLVTD